MATTADSCRMEYVHGCVFCGWHRDASSPTVLSPSCERCGCTLSSVSGANWTGADAGLILGPEPVRNRILRLAAILGAALVALAALRTGYALGGPAVAVAAVGIAGLVSVAVVSASGRIAESSSAPSGR